MKRKITELIIILFFYLMQVSVARVISIANISPNWLIILPVFFGFFCGKNDGMFAGFFAGIMYDLFYSGLFGFTGGCHGHHQYRLLRPHPASYAQSTLSLL